MNPASLAPGEAGVFGLLGSLTRFLTDSVFFLSGGGETGRVLAGPLRNPPVRIGLSRAGPDSGSDEDEKPAELDISEELELDLRIR